MSVRQQLPSVRVPHMNEEEKQTVQTQCGKLLKKRGRGERASLQQDELDGRVCLHSPSTYNLDGSSLLFLSLPCSCVAPRIQAAPCLCPKTTDPLKGVANPPHFLLHRRYVFHLQPSLHRKKRCPQSLFCQAEENVRQHSCPSHKRGDRLLGHPAADTALGICQGKRTENLTTICYMDSCRHRRFCSASTVPYEHIFHRHSTPCCTRSGDFSV